MTHISDEPNKLIHEKSPYLLQHAYNPVSWYPWGEEAFAKAKSEDKPIFLSIGYSTCHWCHVMAHESFEDEEVARLLNQYFVSIKVDKEERPDIDSVYMSVCQAFTGSGGWPTSIFMTQEQKPFFAGTYFPKIARYGTIGLTDLLSIIHEKWETDREELLRSAEMVISHLEHEVQADGNLDESLINQAVNLYERSYDEEYGGFGNAPKFPAPHNLLFIMNYYENSHDMKVINMVEKTLMQMYRGGIFDHIGYGFSRYSTDRYFLVPHFEKMLYDNALLIISYSKAYSITQNKIYKEIAEKTAAYIIREMTSPDGGFYSAQDADSEGVEGKYYVFKPKETVNLLGEEVGNKFNQYYDITDKGNFEGKNIPNLLHQKEISNQFDSYLSEVYEYRRERHQLHLDDKILTSWNCMMIVAFTYLYRITGNEEYLTQAEKAEEFIEDNLCKNDILYVSFREGKRSGKGYLDDYAAYTWALISLYDATYQKDYLEKAEKLCEKTVDNFYDTEDGGFFLYGKDHEELIIKPKETYDGAIPSGNSVMAYNLIRLSQVVKEFQYNDLAEKQLTFMTGHASHYPAGYSFFLIALSQYKNPPESITIVLKEMEELKGLATKIHPDASVTILEQPTDEYKLINDKITFYICKNHSCLPPTNELKS